jgi:hypothetical protein
MAIITYTGNSIQKSHTINVHMHLNMDKNEILNTETKS